MRIGTPEQQPLSTIELAHISTFLVKDVGIENMEYHFLFQKI